MCGQMDAHSLIAVRYLNGLDFQIEVAKNNGSSDFSIPSLVNFTLLIKIR